MAQFIASIQKAAQTPWGRAVRVVVYILMLAAICLMFTGNGEFIYEGF